MVFSGVQRKCDFSLPWCDLDMNYYYYYYYYYYYHYFPHFKYYVSFFHRLFYPVEILQRSHCTFIMKTE